MDKIKASVGILTHNSGASLQRALESVKDFDDIVICDGASTDDTHKIARAYGARIISQNRAFQNADGSLKDYSGVRNQCLDAARHDWFLYIDSDESISPELHAEIAEIAAAPRAGDEPLVYRVPQVMIMDGITIRWSSIYPAYQYRFFNKKSGARFGKPVHERIYFDIKTVRTGTLRGAWHTYRSREEWVHYYSRMRKYRDHEIAFALSQGESLGHYLRWTLYGSIKTSAGTLIKALLIYLLHGFKETIPVEGELGRVLSPLALLGRVTSAHLGLYHPQIEKAVPSRPPKLYYLSNNRIPTPTGRAYAVHIMHMCAAFAAAGKQVTLVLPGKASRDAFAEYGLTPSFAIEYLPTLELPLWIPGAYALKTLVFGRAARRYLADKEGTVYARGEMALFLARLPMRLAFIWETHVRPVRPERYRAAATRSDAIVAITKQYAAEIPSIWNVPRRRVLYAPDGVALDAFKDLPSKESARTELDLPQDKRIVLYAGSDLPWKGLWLLREASDRLPEDTLTVFVGNVEEKGSFSAKRFFAGVVPYTRIPLWLAAADCLVLTGDPESATARSYTSPLKLFEYMAVERPIIATDLPAVRDVLTEQEAYLAEPTPEGLAYSIGEALAHPLDAELRARHARALVERYSWDARARAILAHIRAA